MGKLARGQARRYPAGLTLCSGNHAPARAPAFQRGPQPAVEAEAVDWHRARQRADALQPRAGPLKAALLQHAPRRRIGDARRRLDRLAVEVGEDVIDDRAHGFGTVALAPVLDAEPVAHLRRMPVALQEP